MYSEKSNSLRDVVTKLQLALYTEQVADILNMPPEYVKRANPQVVEQVIEDLTKLATEFDLIAKPPPSPPPGVADVARLQYTIAAHEAVEKEKALDEAKKAIERAREAAQKRFKEKRLWSEEELRQLIRTVIHDVEVEAAI